MSGDYSSAAKSLSLPISRRTSPSPERDDTFQPTWSRRISSRARRSSFSRNETASQQLLRTADKVQRNMITTFRKLTRIQQILVIAAAIALSVLTVLFLVFSQKIFGVLAPAAKRWRDVPGGWMILWALTFVFAFPPLIGYSSAVTVTGFVYGLPKGWLIVASATVLGSLGSFIASRTVLSKYVQRLVGGDKRFEALALTLKHDGLKILCMIRFCPLPYSLSNAAMATFPTVHPLSFAMATFIASPKLLIHVFIGSRLADIAERGGTMDTSTRLINYASIITSVTLGAIVGWVIYGKTTRRAKELETEALEAESQAPRGDAGRPYGDSSEDADVAALMSDDDISLWNQERSGFHDEFTDDSDEDVFRRGDMDLEAATEGGKPR